jgi:hypothetical protein
VSAVGYGWERGKHGNAAAWRRHVLNRFKIVQMVQMKFEFLQTLVGSKDTFLHSKNLKENMVGKHLK